MILQDSLNSLCDPPAKIPLQRSRIGDKQPKTYRSAAILQIPLSASGAPVLLPLSRLGTVWGSVNVNLQKNGMPLNQSTGSPRMP
jgi:hypothetical protein